MDAFFATALRELLAVSVVAAVYERVTLSEDYEGQVDYQG